MDSLDKIGSRPRLAYWTPLPPEQSGISDYSATLLPLLNEHHDLEVFANSIIAGLMLRPIPVHPMVSYIGRATAKPFDLNVYQMGNNTRFHHDIYQRASREPGLVDLHDPSLLDLHLELKKELADPDRFWDEVAYCEGSQAVEQLRSDLLDPTGVALDRLKYPLIRHLVRGSRAIVVHSEFARTMVQGYAPQTPIFVAPLPAKHISIEAGEASNRGVRQALGWQPDQLVIGVFGIIAPNNYTLAALTAFHQAHLDYPHMRLIVAGYNVVPKYADECNLFIREHGLTDVVLWDTDVPAARMDEYVQTCDLINVLRRPTAGGTSAVFPQAFAAGKVVLASDVPQLADYDPAYCWLVPTEPTSEFERLTEYYRYAVNNLAAVRLQGQKARQFANVHLSVETCVNVYNDAIQAALDRATELRIEPVWSVSQNGKSRFASPSPRHSITGVHFIGDVKSAIGLSEAAFNTLEALLKTDIPVSFSDLNYACFPDIPSVDRSRWQVAESLPQGKQQPISLFYFNLQEMLLRSEEMLIGIAGPSYRIANWFWELPQLSSKMQQNVNRVDEIWVSSQYTQEAFTRAANVPVTVIPVPIILQPSGNAKRARFGLPEDRYLFFFHFTATSGDGRKNPRAIIQAFREAFGTTSTQRPDGPVLVLKAQHLDLMPQIARELTAALDEVGGVLLTENYSRPDMADLLTCIDCYVSLHRAEGFGMGMAEAMYLGKPVIGTGYSGNMDFMTDSNSYPVRYYLRMIEDSDHNLTPGYQYLYEPGQVWAEPDIHHAAQLMHALFENPQQGRLIGQHAAITIREYASPEAVGALMKERLLGITQMLAHRSDRNGRNAT